MKRVVILQIVLLLHLDIVGSCCDSNDTTVDKDRKWRIADDELEVSEKMIDVMHVKSKSKKKRKLLQEADKKDHNSTTLKKE